MSIEPFKTIHSLYKRSNRIKALVRMQSSNLSTTLNIFEVYSARLKELLAIVEHEYSKDGILESMKIRLAAIQLALHYNHLDSLIYSSFTLTDHITTDLINTEIQITTNRLQKFNAFRLNDVICLIYFKILNLLSKIYIDPLKDLNTAKYWIQAAEQMYMELVSLQNDRKYYDYPELFSKSAILQPSRIGLATVDRLYTETIALHKQIQRIENDTFNSSIEWLQTHQTHSMWLYKLVSVIPQLIEYDEYKVVAYFLLIARKMTNEQSNVMIHSSIATNWMHYFFGIFNRSQNNFQQYFANDVLMISHKSLLLKRLCKNNRENHERFVKLTTNFESLFDCFSDSIPLSMDELELCRNSLETIDEANILLHFSINLMKQLIRDVNFNQNPMDFIIHHYQISDLMTIAIILTNNPDDCFNFQTQRFQYICGMIQWLYNYCPDVYKTAANIFLNDLNEIILDLYAINFNRILMCMDFDSNDNVHILQQIKNQLAELHENTSKNTSNKPTTE